MKGMATYTYLCEENSACLAIFIGSLRVNVAAWLHFFFFIEMAQELTAQAVAQWKFGRRIPHKFGYGAPYNSVYTMLYNHLYWLVVWLPFFIFPLILGC